MKIDNSSHPYINEKIKIESLPSHPTYQFQKWFQEAINANCSEYNAMSLATATKEAIPSCRTVLLKSFDESSLIFFTNYESRKGKELIENPRASVVLFWRELMRQVIVEGKVEKTSRAETEEYFATRPRGSQLGAWSSRQDQVISSREYLEAEFSMYEEKYKDMEIPAPDYWGGFRIIPQRFEFWQGMQNRLHERFQYTQTDDGSWKIDRLSP
jgi:pyridoxamine 5'-phosphate oxidase